MSAVNRFDALIGQNIQETRRQAGFNRREFAAVLGINGEQVGRYENGVDHIRSSHLWDMAEVLDVPIVHFFPEYLLSQWARECERELDA